MYEFDDPTSTQQMKVWFSESAGGIRVTSNPGGATLELDEAVELQQKLGEMIDEMAEVKYGDFSDEEVERAVESVAEQMANREYEELDPEEYLEQEKPVDDESDLHWEEQTECQECGADDQALRAIEMKGKPGRSKLCRPCFQEAVSEGRVGEEDPRL